MKVTSCYLKKMDLSVFRSKEILSYLIFFSAFVSNAQKEQIHFGLSASYAIPLGEFRDRVGFAYFDNATAKDGWALGGYIGYSKKKFLYEFSLNFSSFKSQFSAARENDRLLTQGEIQFMLKDSLSYNLTSKRWNITDMSLLFGYVFQKSKFTFTPKIGVGIIIVNTPAFSISYGQEEIPQNYNGPLTRESFFVEKSRKAYKPQTYVKPLVKLQFEIAYFIIKRLAVSSILSYNQTFNANYYYRKDVKEGYRGLLSTFNIGLRLRYTFQLPKKTEKL